MGGRRGSERLWRIGGWGSTKLYVLFFVDHGGFFKVSRAVATTTSPPAKPYYPYHPKIRAVATPSAGLTAGINLSIVAKVAARSSIRLANT